MAHAEQAQPDECGAEQAPQLQSPECDIETAAAAVVVSDRHDVQGHDDPCGLVGREDASDRPHEAQPHPLRWGRDPDDVARVDMVAF
jgi:hypothetical protein